MSKNADKRRTQKWNRKIEKERSNTRRESPREAAYQRDMEKIMRVLGMDKWY